MPLTDAEQAALSRVRNLSANVYPSRADAVLLVAAVDRLAASEGDLPPEPERQQQETSNDLITSLRALLDQLNSGQMTDVSATRQRVVGALLALELTQAGDQAENVLDRLLG